MLLYHFLRQRELQAIKKDGTEACLQEASVPICLIQQKSQLVWQASENTIM